MKKTLTFLFLFAIQSSIFAQFSKENFAVRDVKDGQKIAVFTDSLLVSLGPQDQGWYPIKVKFFVEKKSVSGDSVLQADVALLNGDKNQIGTTVAEVKVQLRQAEGRGFYKFYEVILSGFVKSYDIEYGSIPEVALEKIINQKSVVKQREDIAAYFDKMEFEKQEFGEFTAFTYLNKAATFESPEYRTIVVYRGETLLYCVISRNEHMQFEKQKDFKEDNTGNYFFFQRAQDKIYKQLQEIAYSYIPL